MDILAHHLHVRTRNGEPCFKVDRDFFDLLMLLPPGLGGLLLAFCLMTNHLHFVIEGPAVHTMRWLGAVLVQFTRLFNARHGREGNLFGKITAEPQLTTPEDLAFTIRYVHDNPVKAKIVERRIEWPWSSQRIYDGLSLSGFPNAGYVRRLVAGSEWRLRSAKAEVPVLAVADKITTPRTNLEWLLAGAAQTYLIHPDDIRADVRAPLVKAARALFIETGRREAYSLRQLGEHVGRSEGRASRLVDGEVPEVGLRIVRTLCDTPTFQRRLIFAKQLPPAAAA